MASWLLLAAAQPGLLRPDGFGHLAFTALVPWALVARRPGPRARLVEWGAAVLGLALWFGWMRALLPILLVPMTVIPALYFLLAGRVLRGLAPRWPLALAVPVAWMVFELVRWFLPFPFSFGWWRLGTLAADTEWLAGSARVWGVWGLSYTFAAFAGWVADCILAWRQEVPLARFGLGLHVAGLGPVALAAALSAAVPAPATEAGPGALLVTPGLAQERKAFSQDPLLERFLDPLDLTVQGLARAQAKGQSIDFVAWPESMLPAVVVEEGVLEAFDAGTRGSPFLNREWTRIDLQLLQETTQELVRGVIFGERALVSRPLRERLARHPGAAGQAWREGRPLLPSGVAFVAGVESVVVEDAELRRLNAVCVWHAGRPSALASKQHLVPAAEDPYPAAHFPWLVSAIHAVAGYVPDFVVRDAPRILAVEGGAARSFQMGVAVCYDQAFDRPFTSALRSGPLDFHLVASNEAWYERTLEMDHMLAFARLRAICTGRAVLRATNSGISGLVDARGRVRGLIVQDGRRKQVRGTQAITVPVPVAGSSGTLTPYVATEPYQIGFWWLLALFGWIASRPRVTHGESGVGEGAAS